MKHLFAWLLMFCATINPAAAQMQYNSVYLEDLTWPEVRDFLKRGGSTIIIPACGTEQNGPHLALGKHNAIVHFAAGEIARELGNALVAPVLTYVPEGRISPPEGHMRFPGTISISEINFAGLIEDAARSFKQHGFVNIVFISDHSGSEATMQKVAAKLSREWSTEPAQVVYISEYYNFDPNKSWAKKNELTGDNIYAHAGFADTSQLMATDKRLVRENLIKSHSKIDAYSYGVAGDPTLATSQYGADLLKTRIDAATRQIRAMQK